MKLWLLRAIPELVEKMEPPFDAEWDEARGFVVRAESEEHARVYASEQAGFEHPPAWLSSKFTTCVELPQAGEAGIVLRDFHAG